MTATLIPFPNAGLPPPALQRPTRPGQRVLVTDGPYTGYVGTVDLIGRDNADVRLDLLATRRRVIAIDDLTLLPVPA